MQTQICTHTEELLVHCCRINITVFIDLNCTTLSGSCLSLQVSMLFIVIDTILLLPLLLSHYLGFLHSETEHIAPLSPEI